MFAFSAQTTKDLTASLETSYGSLKLEEIKLERIDVLVAIVDPASGTSRKSALLYTRKSKDAPWMLLLYRATNSSSIAISVEGGSLIAYSKGGRKLFIVPAEAMNLGFDATEQ